MGMGTPDSHLVHPVRRSGLLRRCCNEGHQCPECSSVINDLACKQLKKLWFFKKWSSSVPPLKDLREDSTKIAVIVPWGQKNTQMVPGGRRVGQNLPHSFQYLGRTESLYCCNGRA